MHDHARPACPPLFEEKSGAKSPVIASPILEFRDTSCGGLVGCSGDISGRAGGAKKTFGGKEEGEIGYDGSCCQRGDGLMEEVLL
ncbi:hypothetical protein NC652_037530 [Populus alba x Populus x berolinensis]|nr:hypothetical protein NC652_037530 [Populus alba x Populus x berolinensis]